MSYQPHPAAVRESITGETFHELPPEEQALWRVLNTQADTYERAPVKRKKRKLPKVLSPAEADRLLRAAEHDPDLLDSRLGIRNRLILELMYRAGLRVSEAVGLALRDVERDGVIRLYDAKGGDGTAYFDADTVVPLLDRWLHIRAQLLNSNVAATPLFVGHGGESVTVRYVQRLVKRLKIGAGITGICTPHVLRHSFATELIGEGLTLPEVQVALRHANLATTAVYLHVRDESLRRKISRRGQTRLEDS